MQSFSELLVKFCVIFGVEY